MGSGRASVGRGLTRIGIVLALALLSLWPSLTRTTARSGPELKWTPDLRPRA
jgi:hypothetical protein